MSPAMEQLSLAIPRRDVVSDVVSDEDLAEQARQDQFFADAHAKCDAQLEQVEQLEEVVPRISKKQLIAEQDRHHDFVSSWPRPSTKRPRFSR